MAAVELIRNGKSLTIYHYTRLYTMWSVAHVLYTIIIDQYTIAYTHQCFNYGEGITCHQQGYQQFP